MKVAALALAVALALLTLLPLPAAVAHTVDSPRFALGDFWEYATNSTLEGLLWLNGTYRYEVSGETDTTVLGVSHHVYLLDLVGGGPIEGDVVFQDVNFPSTGTWQITGRDYLESQGLKSVYGLVDIRANGTLLPPLEVPWTFRLQNTTRDRILEDTWRFPLYDGKNGTLVTESTSGVDVTYRVGASPPFRESTNRTTNRTIVFEAIAEENVVLPIGTFNALVIRQTWSDGFYDDLYYDPAIGGNALVESFNATGGQTGRSVLVAYGYAAGAPPSDLLLSLPPMVWIVAAAAVVGAVPFSLVVRRRRRRRRREIEEQTLRDLAGEDVTSGPRDRS